MYCKAYITNKYYRWIHPRWGTSVHFCWVSLVCAAGLSKPLPHLSHFCWQFELVTPSKVLNCDPILVAPALKIWPHPVAHHCIAFIWEYHVPQGIHCLRLILVYSAFSSSQFEMNVDFKWHVYNQKHLSSETDHI